MAKLSDIEFSLLSKIWEYLRIMSGRNGSRILGGTDARTGLHVLSFQVREDATAFTTLTCTNGTVTRDKTYFLGGASGFLAGDTITAEEGYRFTEIDLSAGSILATGPYLGT